MELKYNGYVCLQEDEDYKDFIGLESEYTESVWSSLMDKINEDLKEFNTLKEVSEEEHEMGSIYKSLVPNVSIRIYASDKKISYEKALESQILTSIGELSMVESWVGYSEYTIMGYSVDTFELVGNGGKHDLTEILKSYIGKYVWFVVEVIEK